MPEKVDDLRMVRFSLAFVGGFDLAAEWMGWENVFHCENNTFCQKILKYYWPEAKSYGDIKETDFTIWRGLIDILTGGFPCQPYSVAGKRKGKDDDRHLWPEMLRAIREIRPRWVVGENVPGLLNWKRGLVLDEIKADLEAAGFEVFPSLILPACGKNAPHRRDRLWVVAHAPKGRQRELQPISAGKNGKEIWSKNSCGFKSIIENGIITNTECLGQQEQGESKRSGNKKTYRNWEASWANDDGEWPTQSPVCSRDDGLSGELAGITVSKHRKESLMAYGNSIVPQVVYEIFKAIEQVEISLNDNLQ